MKEILLSSNQIALVDDEDYDNLIIHKWSIKVSSGKYYAHRHMPGTNDGKVLMHRQIMNCPKGSVVDHIDGNGLNNQKSNLRICTPKDNVRNRSILKTKKSSQYIGVYQRQQTKKRKDLGQKEPSTYQARIMIDRKNISLGSFASEKEAALAYNKAATLHYGEYAKLNEID